MVWKAMRETGNEAYWQPKYAFFWLNLIFVVYVGLLLVFVPPYFVVYYLWNFKNWERPSFEQKYGSPLEGLIKTKRSALFYPIFFLLRRIALAFMAVFLNDYFVFQVWTFIFLSVINLCYLLHFKPFECTLQQGLEVMNEYTCLVLSYVVFGLNPDFMDSDLARYQVGLLLMGILIVNILINFYFLFRTILLDYHEGLFRKRGRANRLCVMLCRPCSRKLDRSLRIRLQQMEEQSSQSSVRK